MPPSWFVDDEEVFGRHLRRGMTADSNEGLGFVTLPQELLPEARRGRGRRNSITYEVSGEQRLQRQSAWLTHEVRRGRHIVLSLSGQHDDDVVVCHTESDE